VATQLVPDALRESSPKRVWITAALAGAAMLALQALLFGI
jgi:hypothetical protein